MNTTTELPPLGTGFKVAQNLEDVFKWSGASRAGYSAVSEWLTCPERSRLHALGVQRKGRSSSYEEKLNALDLGTLIHYLRALRILHGEQSVYDSLNRWQNDLSPDDHDKAFYLMKTYDQLFPLGVPRLTPNGVIFDGGDPFEYLGVEVEVRTELKTRDGGSCIRSVRYDTVIRPLDGTGVYSFEAKTTGKSGEASMQPYIPQGICQNTIWNANPALVAKYGEMRGTIYDAYIKTQTPNADRYGPHFYSKRQQVMALEYLRLPEDGTVYRKNADGSYPKMLHACWGRWAPCQYIDLCHEGSHGEFEFKDGTPLDEGFVR